MFVFLFGHLGSPVISGTLSKRYQPQFSIETDSIGFVPPSECRVEVLCSPYVGTAYDKHSRSSGKYTYAIDHFHFEHPSLLAAGLTSTADISISRYHNKPSELCM